MPPCRAMTGKKLPTGKPTDNDPTPFCQPKNSALKTIHRDKVRKEWPNTHSTTQRATFSTSTVHVLLSERSCNMNQNTPQEVHGTKVVAHAADAKYIHVPLYFCLKDHVKLVLTLAQNHETNKCCRLRLKI